jgi:hypothetical protein
MRYLAIARLRLLTTTRAASPLFAVTVAAAILPAAYLAFIPDEVIRAEADSILSMAATIALAAWVVHALLLVLACNAFGNETLLKPHLTSMETPAASDLIDTAPISLKARFWGETAGILAAAMTIHLCTLPVLVLIFALGPLPASMLFVAEAAIITFVFLASAGGAWKRRAPRTKWSGTRSARSGILFAILLLMTVRYTTQWEAFRDSLALFVREPSARIWAVVTNAIDNPLLFFTLLSLLYTGYIAYYYASSVRTARR